MGDGRRVSNESIDGYPLGSDDNDYSETYSERISRTTRRTFMEWVTDFFTEGGYKSGKSVDDR